MIALTVFLPEDVSGSKILVKNTLFVHGSSKAAQCFSRFFIGTFSCIAKLVKRMAVINLQANKVGITQKTKCSPFFDVGNRLWCRDVFGKKDGRILKCAQSLRLANPPRINQTVRTFGYMIPFNIEAKPIRSCNNLDGITALINSFSDRIEYTRYCEQKRS